MIASRRLPTLCVVVPFAALSLLALSAPALAADSEKNEPQIVLTGQVLVQASQTVGDVVIFNGPATIEGTVRGSVTSFNGNVSISGTVTDDVTSFNGDVTVASGARIGGDLVTQSAPSVASGGAIEGDRRRVDTDLISGRFTWISQFAVWVAVSVSILVLGLLLLLFAPRAAESVAVAAVERIGASIGWGVGLFFGLPIVAVIALVTIVGIPFGLGTLLGLALIYSLGYTASCFALGRALLKPPTSRYLAFLAGLAIVRVASLIPFVSGLVWFLAVVYGLGMLAVAARRREAAASVTTPAMMPPPPPPAPA
ncbi:MAG TPA: polymer-forming cytoskeletal protein [Actinomycetota bacterium]|nr:polymer-forming cytoskeletal protein [Actinomycetota bacterium]